MKKQASSILIRFEHGGKIYHGWYDGDSVSTYEEDWSDVAGFEGFSVIDSYRVNGEFSYEEIDPFDLPQDDWADDAYYRLEDDKFSRVHSNKSIEGIVVKRNFKKRASTRSNICKLLSDGTYRCIYCHWDGSPDGVGKILQEFYTDDGKIDELLDLGLISKLGKDIGVKHPFAYDEWIEGEFDRPPGYGEMGYRESMDLYNERWGDMTVAYGRDREDYVAAFFVESLNELSEEYIYSWDGTQWACQTGSGEKVFGRTGGDRRVERIARKLDRGVSSMRKKGNETYLWVIKDAFRNEYEIYSIFEDVAAAMRYIEGLDRVDVFEKAIEAYVPGFIGVAQMNLGDGTLVGASFSGGSGDIETHFINLFSIRDADWDMPTEDWLSSDEIEDYNEHYSETHSVEEYMDEKGLDAAERFLEALLFYDATIEVEDVDFPEIMSIEKMGSANKVDDVGNEKKSDKMKRNFKKKADDDTISDWAYEALDREYSEFGSSPISYLEGLGWDVSEWKALGVEQWAYEVTYGADEANKLAEIMQGIFDGLSEDGDDVEDFYMDVRESDDVDDFVVNSVAGALLDYKEKLGSLGMKDKRVERIAKRLDKANVDSGLRKKSVLVSELRGEYIGGYGVEDVNDGLVDLENSIFVKFVDFGEDEIVSDSDRDKWDKVLNELGDCGIESIAESGAWYKIYASFDWSGLDYRMEEGEEYFIIDLAIRFVGGKVDLSMEDLGQIADDLYAVETKCRGIADGFEDITVVEFVD